MLELKSSTVSPNYTVNLVAGLQVDVLPLQISVTGFSATLNMQDLKTVLSLPLAEKRESLLDTLFSG